MSMLFKTMVERKVDLNDGRGERWMHVRSYLVIAEDGEEADKMTPVFVNEFCYRVQPQEKSPYVYLLPGGEE